MSAAKRAVARHGLALDDFPLEQQITINRLRIAGKFRSDEETIMALTDTGLFLLGLDPIVRSSYDRLAEIVGIAAENANEAGDDILVQCVDEQAGVDWTKRQRAAEAGAR